MKVGKVSAFPLVRKTLSYFLMDEIKEQFLEILEFYPHTYRVKVKRTPYEELNNIIITAPKEKKHVVFLPSKEDLFRYELLSSLIVLGEKHHLLSTEYYDNETQDFMYDFMEQFEKLIKPIKFAWAGKVAAEYSPDPDKLLQEALKKIEIEYLNSLYRGNRRAALEVLPFVSFAKGLDLDWDFYNHEKLNALINEIVKAEPNIDNLLKFADRLRKYITCFCTFDVVFDESRGFEVFSLS